MDWGGVFLVIEGNIAVVSGGNLGFWNWPPVLLGLSLPCMW